MGKSVLAFDIVAIVLLAVSLYPEFTGYAVHEWLGVVVTVALAAHVVIRLPDYFKTAAAGFKARRPGLMSTTLLNTVIFADVVLCALSGLLISGAILPAFGLYADGYFVWNTLHSFSAKLLLALTLVHIVLSWPRITAIFRQSKSQNGKDGAAEQ